MNKNLRKAMISAICMLIVGVMSLTGVTYAWFTTSKTAEVSGIKVDIATASGGIELQGTTGGWTTFLTAEDTNKGTSSKMPVSTVKTNGGALKFYTATVDEENALNSDTVLYIDAVEDNANYFYTTFQMRNPNATTATVTIDPTDLITTTKKEGVKLALRWALVEIVDEGNGKQYIFAGDNTEANYLGVQKEGKFDCKVTTENEYLKKVELDKVASFLVKVEPYYNNDGSENTAKVRKFALYAWLEGNDANCNNSLSGADFSVNLKFNTELAAN